ncbi:MFS transporter [Undibacterium sp. Jales W-56]|uniref:MFS transporter n=1 Tax=Undibacterium sp. Jales W-56 TaxID=2897325 RepID=UPI0021CEB312|nr:MFS transporter [Undibacterium sp. Jales W-56]MCU6435489.1 MFS transporter [Undibacterium sp. Jales W-56]
MQIQSRPFNSVFNSYLIYVGVALASAGVALYTPLIVSETGKSFSGTWAASILFGLNLGRVIGSHLGSRYPGLANHPFSVTANILLEGIALYCMAYLQQAWALAVFALLAGLGSGLSFPGLKNYLLKLKELDQASLFSRLAFAIRMGLVLGYLIAGWVPNHSLKIVFLIVLITFIAYAIFMLYAMRAIARYEANANAALAAQRLTENTAASDARKLATPTSSARLPILFLLSNAVFWCFAVQPMIGFSLHIPKYTPEIPVSTPFWLAALVIIFFQIPVSKRAVRTLEHFRFLQIGYACLFASFALMLVAGNHGISVIASAILLSFGQVFYGPSFDVLIARHANRSSEDTGKLMSQQIFYQSVGTMIGSLAGGVLFDLAQTVHMPSLNWLLLSLGSLWMMVLSKNKIPALYRKA